MSACLPPPAWPPEDPSCWLVSQTQPYKPLPPQGSLFPCVCSGVPAQEAEVGERPCLRAQTQETEPSEGRTCSCRTCLFWYKHLEAAGGLLSSMNSKASNVCRTACSTGRPEPTGRELPDEPPWQAQVGRCRAQLPRLGHLHSVDLTEAPPRMDSLSAMHTQSPHLHHWV